MGFWDTKRGTKVTGTEQDAGAPVFGLIPSGTKAIAEVDSFKRESFQGSVNYQVQWKIITGSYAGFMVRQKLDVYAEDEKKSDRAKNMMYRLFKLAGIDPSNGDNEPTPGDLMKFKHVKLGLLVMEWEQDGKRGNWINMLYETKGFESKDGKFLAEKVKSESFKNESSAAAADDDGEDLPF